MTNLRKHKNYAVENYNSYTQYVNQIVNYDEKKWLDFFDKEIKLTLKRSFGSIKDLQSIAFVPNLVIWSFHLQQLLPFTSPCINFNKEEPIDNLHEAMKNVRRGLKQFSFTELLVENEFTKCFQFRQTSKKKYLSIEQHNEKNIVVELNDAFAEQMEKQHHNHLRKFIDNFSDELLTWRGERIEILKERKEFLDAFYKTLFWGIINIFKTGLIKNIYFIPITITEKKKARML
ncbi:MAG: hypothetical protein BA862_12275 [Desulfobulbaceae bacterium S3730MH12]|nr:MAG: hypothetical protein BA862_12275 [Desulfobulbaceae bacterium S3730MH12]